jgi:hypothetical protein
VLAASLAALLAGIGGCSGSSGGPRSLPPLSTTPAATTSPPVSEKTELQQATAVVRDYFQLLNSSTSLATARALAALMTADCKCRRVSSSTREVALKQEHYFGRTTVTNVTPALDGPGMADVLVNYSYTRSGIAAKDGRVLSSSPGRRGAALDFKLRSDGASWLIAELVYVRTGTRH